MNVSDLLADFEKWFKYRPMIVVNFSKGSQDKFRRSKRGFRHFSAAFAHEYCNSLKPPTLCLANFSAHGTFVDGDYDNDFYSYLEDAEREDDREVKEVGTGWHLGLFSAKSAITTVDTRLSFKYWQSLDLATERLLEMIKRQEDAPTGSRLAAKLSSTSLFELVTPKEALLALRLLSKSRERIGTLAFLASKIQGLKKKKTQEWSQSDAIRTAMAAFGLEKSELAESLTLPAGSDSRLYEVSPQARVIEDNVIAVDASLIPGFSLLERHCTGHAVFRKGKDRLDVYTANRGPLEGMLGVDLIYINERTGSCVMLQYKMLEVAPKSKAQEGFQECRWLYRPDAQLFSEVARMKLPKFAGKTEDYRLSSDPFLFKFVRRRGDGEQHGAAIIALEHLNKLLNSNKCKGPKGGFLLDYESLEGCYLRESNFIGLLQSGYIGTHRAVTSELKTIIDLVSRNEKAIVVAWERRVADERR